MLSSLAAWRNRRRLSQTENWDSWFCLVERQVLRLLGGREEGEGSRRVRERDNWQGREGGSKEMVMFHQEVAITKVSFV